MTESNTSNRTKILINETFFNLMENKPFEKITVAEICENLKISRGTFYFHYKDKYILIEDIQDKLLYDFKKIIEVKKKNPSNSNSHFNEFAIDEIVNFISSNKRFIKILLSDNSKITFISSLKKGFVDSILSSYPKDIKNKLNVYTTTFNVSGLIAVIESWINSGSEETPEEIAYMLQKIYSRKFIS